jgi:hypothetical protein
MSSNERRQFDRLPISEDAIAVDEAGRRLGLVEQASGGGMLVRLEVPAEEFTLDRQLRITVVEPATGARNTIDMRVRYCQSDSLGLEFVTGRGAQTPEKA